MAQLFYLSYGIVGEFDRGAFRLLSPRWTESAESPAAFASRYALPLLAASRVHDDGLVSYSILETLEDGRVADLTYDRETRFNDLLTRMSKRGHREFREANVLLARVSWARYHLTRLLEQHSLCHRSAMGFVKAFAEVTDYQSKSDFAATYGRYSWMQGLPLDELTISTGEGISGMSEDLQAFLVAVRSSLDSVASLLSCEAWARERGVKWPASMKGIANLYLEQGDVGSCPMPGDIYQLLSAAWSGWGEPLRDFRDVAVHHGGFGHYGMPPTVWSVAGRTCTVAVSLYLPSNPSDLKESRAVPVYVEWEDSLPYAHVTYVRLVRLVESVLDSVTVEL